MARIILILALLPALAACGVRGGLQTPEPMWGEKDRTAPPLPEPYERDSRGRDTFGDPLAPDFDTEAFEDEDGEAGNDARFDDEADGDAAPDNDG